MHYKAELETSPELDAITAQVVAQLKAMQAALGQRAGSPRSPDDLAELSLELLTKLERDLGA